MRAVMDAVQRVLLEDVHSLVGLVHGDRILCSAHSAVCLDILEGGRGV